MTLGDKIVVMDGGDIMQAASPYEIYNEPENLFVAQFIGSPSTNFFECVVEKQGEETVLQSNLFRLAFDGGNKLNTGDVVTLGVRPEHLELSSDPAANRLFEADIDVIEPHGPNDAIYLSAGDETLTAITKQNQIQANEGPLSIGFDTDRIWLFDEDGQRAD